MTAWAQSSVGEVCEVIAGQSPASSAYNERGEGLPFYQGKKDFTDRYLAPPSTWTTAITKIAVPNDILMSVRAPVGPINVAQQEVCIGRGLAAIRAGSEIDNGFLWYALLWLQPKIVGNAGAVFPSINKKQIEALPIPLPPLEVQKRIVAVLDQAFAALDRARALAEANLADAEELFATTLDTEFNVLRGVGEHPLSGLIEIAHGFAFKSKDFSDVEDERLPIVLTPGNYAENAILYFREGKTKRLACAPPDEYLFEVGELTIVMTDLSSKMKILGKPAFIDREGLLHNQRIGRIRFLDDRLHPRFLYYFMRTRRYLNKIRETATGTMVRHTAPKRVLACLIPLPPMDIQERMVERLDALEAQREELALKYAESSNDLDDLRQSLLQKAFAGELT